MSDSRDPKAEGPQRDVQVVTVALGGPYPPELIHPARGGTSPRTLFRLVPEYEINDPAAALETHHRLRAFRRRERIWTRRLLKCKPFYGLTEYQIRDERPRRTADGCRLPLRRICDCPMRPLLLRSLAGTLASWESAQVRTPAPSYIRACMGHIAAVSDDLASSLTALHRSGVVFDDQTIGPRSLVKHLRTLSHEMRQRQLEHRAHAGQAVPGAPHSDARSLIIHTVRLMFEDFRAFGHNTKLNARGQTILKKEFPRDAIYHALAAILNGLRIRNTHRKRFTAAGIQQLLRRHPLKPYMYSYMYPRDDRILGLDN